MKKFLIIGNGNAVTYCDIFPLFKENKIWLGASKGLGGSMEFIINADLFDSSKTSNYREENGKYYVGVMLSTWFTNLTHTNIDKPPLELHKHYNADEYPTYLNYNAINVDKVKDIPLDYDGVMGVPISFLDKYNREQFEIIGSANANVLPNGWKGMSKEFIDLYYSQGGTGQYKEGYRLEHYFTKDGKAKIPYKRILIKRK